MIAMHHKTRGASRILARPALWAVLLLCAGSYGTPVRADLAEKARFDIAPQALQEALIKYTTQSGVQVTSPAEIVSGKASAGVVGVLGTRIALKQLLKGTNLTFEVVNDNTVTIRATGSIRGDSVPVIKTSSRSVVAAPALKLARAGGVEPAAEREAIAKDKEDAAVAREENDKGIPEILVEGQRGANTGIRRTEDDVQPYVVFNSEDIEAAMAPDLESFLRTRLPMNYVGETQSMTAGFNAGQSTINLRGLGADETLVLVNGRRMASVSKSLGLELGQPDVNGIPLSSIERIEILPSTAGGIYGGSATGGVVNIILKRDYQGLDVRAGFDGTVHGGGATRRLEASGGFSLEGGRTRINAAVSSTRSERLSNGDRDFRRRLRALVLTTNPASVLRYQGVYGPRGYTTNIRSASGNPLVLASTGQSLGSDVVHVPVGYSGPASDNGLAFLQAAGSYNLDMPDDNLNDGDKEEVVSNPTIKTASLGVHRDFSERIEAFVDMSYSDNRADGAYNGILDGNRGLMPVGPVNPFTEPVYFHMPLANLSTDDTAITAHQEYRNVAGGVIVRLPRRWSAQAEYSRSASTSRAAMSYYHLTSEAFQAMLDGRLDVFRDVNAFPLDLSPYYVPQQPQRRYGWELIQKTASLRVAGPIWRLPGGPLNLSALLENRKEDTKPAISTDHSRDEGVPSYTYYSARGTSTDSGYLELTAPLVSAANARPGVQGLELQVSYRNDRSLYKALSNTDFAVPIPSPDGPFPNAEHEYNRVNASQYTFGVRYQPSQQLALRASLGKGVLPPSLSQLAASEYPFLVSFYSTILMDPKRDGETLASLTRLRTGGNADLISEVSESVSAGMIFTPDVLPGLRVSVDYTRIDKTDEIRTLAPQDLLNVADQGFSDRVIRGPLTPADEAAGFTGGPVLELDAGAVNVASSKLEAYDVQIDYTWKTGYGDFTANLIGTWQPHLQLQILASEPLRELANTNSPDSALKLRGNMGITWNRGAWTAGWNMQYYNSYSIYNATNSEATNATWALTQGATSIPSQNYHDLFGRYRFNGAGSARWGWLENVEVLASIQNVLDTMPPVQAVGYNQFVGYSPYGDPRLRRYSISVSKSFGR